VVKVKAVLGVPVPLEDVLQLLADVAMVTKIASVHRQADTAGCDEVVAGPVGGSWSVWETVCGVRPKIVWFFYLLK